MRHLIIFLATTLFTFLTSTGYSQTVENLETTVIDTIKKEEVVAPIASTQIAVKSTEATVALLKIKEGLIKREQLEEVNNKNQGLVNTIKNDLKEEPDSIFHDKSPRYLDNRLNYWNRNERLLSSELDRLNKIQHQLDKTTKKLTQEASLWESTLKQIKITDTTGLPPNTQNIDDLLIDIQEQKTNIEHKKHYVNVLLDRTGLIRVDVKLKIEEITSHLKNIEDKVFSSNSNSIFKIDLSTIFKYKPQSYVHQDIIEVKSYLKAKMGVIFFHILLTLGLIYFFKRIKSSHGFDDIPKTSFYLKNLSIIIHHYINTGLLSSLIVSVVLYKNPPVIIADTIRNLLIVPSFILCFKLLPKQYIKNIIAIVVLLALHQFETSLPTESSLSRIVLLVIALGEVALLLDLIRQPQSGSHLLYKSSVILSKTLLIITAIGFIGNLIGGVILAQIALTAVIKILNATIILGLTSIIFNGVVTLAIRSPHMNRFNVISAYGEDLKKKLVKSSNTILLSFWAYLLLKFLYIDDLVIAKISNILFRTYELGSISFSFGSALTFMFIIWLSTILAKTIRILLKEDILSKLDLDKGMPHSIATMVQYTLVVLGVVFAISAVGMPLDTVTIILGAMSVGIGFGLQNIFNNLVSGLILLFERPIQLGDIIEVGPSIGNVKSIGIRSSNVRTFDGAEVIIPNGDLISKDVINWTLSDQKRRIEINIGVSYDADPHKAKELFESIVQDHTDILKLPKPMILFDAFGESSLDFRILFWTSNMEKWLHLKSEITFKVFDILKENKIEIPYPQRDVHFRSKDY